MDLDTECIPLGHIQTYFNIKKSIHNDADWLMRRSGISVSNPDEVMSTILGIDQDSMFRRAGIDVSADDGVGRFISTRQVLNLIDDAVSQLGMPYLGLGVKLSHMPPYLSWPNFSP